MKRPFKIGMYYRIEGTKCAYTGKYHGKHCFSFIDENGNLKEKELV